MKGSVSQHPPQEQGSLLGVEQAKQLAEPLPPFQAAGPFERIDAAWIGQGIDQSLAPSGSQAIAVPFEPWPGLIQAGDAQGPLCRTGLAPAPKADAQKSGEVGLGQGP